MTRAELEAIMEAAYEAALLQGCSPYLAAAIADTAGYLAAQNAAAGLSRSVSRT